MAIRRDEILASLRDELQDHIAILNRMYHPVHPHDAAKAKELEARVAELRAEIRARREELAAGGA